MKNPCLGHAALALALLACAGAHAAVTVYDDPAAFAAATTGAVSYDFSGVDVPQPQGFQPGPQSVAGLDFDSVATGAAFTVAPTYSLAYGGNVFSGQTFTADPSTVVVALPSLDAVAFRFGSYVIAAAGLPVTITLSGGEVYTRTLNTPASNPLFIGFVSTTPLTGITFANDSDTMDIVGFTVASAVPEPAPALLALAGLAALALRSRRAAC